MEGAGRQCLALRRALKSPGGATLRKPTHLLHKAGVSSGHRPPCRELIPCQTEGLPLRLFQILLSTGLQMHPK